MALTDSFYEAVKSGNTRRVRIMMKDSLLVDPTFTDFNNMEKAAGSMPGLYDAHDGRDFITDKALWTDEYMDKLMVQVVSNFSQERINHLKAVVRHLRPIPKTASSFYTSSQHTGTDSTNIPPHRPSYQEQKQRDKQNGDYLYEKIAVGTVVGGVAGGLAAMFADTAVGGGIIVGAIVGGAGVLIVNAFSGGK